MRRSSGRPVAIAAATVGSVLMMSTLTGVNYVLAADRHLDVVLQTGHRRATTLLAELRSIPPDCT